MPRPPAQTARPHDHGGSWAIVVAVAGDAVHRVYRKPRESRIVDSPVIEQAGEIVVKPGNGISLMPDGIHSIDAIAEQPLLHLHLYGLAFEQDRDQQRHLW